MAFLTRSRLLLGVSAALLGGFGYACSGSRIASLAGSGDNAQRVYVAPGEYDELYAFLSGGFSGQVVVYGLPSGRLLKTIPVFSQYAENGWGYSEEMKPMLETSYGFVPWDDLHHTALSQTKGLDDGRWLFVNGNNTPRVARVDLTSFETSEILEIPNAAGNHASPFVTENTEYIVSSTRFSIPVPNRDVPIAEYKKHFKGRFPSSRPISRGRWTSPSSSSCRGSTTTLRARGRGPRPAGCSSPRTTPSRRMSCSR